MRASAESPLLLGLAGTFSAGKDMTAEHLGEYGFMHVSTGDLIREEAFRQGRDIERPTLVEVAIGLRKHYGSLGALVLMSIEKWHDQQDDYPGGLIVGGLRTIGEAQEIVPHGILMYIDAPVEMRYEWVVERNRDKEASKSLEEFIAGERIELEGTQDPAHPHLLAIEQMSDVVIQNTGSKSDMFAKVDRVLFNQIS